MREERIIGLSSLSILSLPEVEMKMIGVHPAARSDVSETVAMETPLLSVKKGTSPVSDNEQAIYVMGEVVREGYGIVCVNLRPYEGLRFDMEFFFYMNDVQVAFLNSRSQKYQILNGAPKRKRNRDRGIRQEFYPAHQSY